jgi:hypothetical protein
MAPCNLRSSGTFGSGHVTITFREGQPQPGNVRWFNGYIEIVNDIGGRILLSSLHVDTNDVDDTDGTFFTYSSATVFNSLTHSLTHCSMIG